MTAFHWQPNWCKIIPSYAWNFKSQHLSKDFLPHTLQLLRYRSVHCSSASCPPRPTGATPRCLGRHDPNTSSPRWHVYMMYPCCLPCTFPPVSLDFGWHSPKDQVEFFPEFLNFTRWSSRNASDSKNGCLSHPLLCRLFSGELLTEWKGLVHKFTAALKQPEDNYPPKLRSGNGNLAISKYTCIKIPLNPFWRLSLRMSKAKIYPTSECECPDHITKLFIGCSWSSSK